MSVFPLSFSVASIENLIKNEVNLNVESGDENLPLIYDVKAIQQYWRKRPLEVLKRTSEIVVTVLPFVCKIVFWEILVRGKIVHHEGLQVKRFTDLIGVDQGPSVGGGCSIVFSVLAS